MESKNKCPKCKGAGIYSTTDSNALETTTNYRCEVCGGKGYLNQPSPMESKLPKILRPFNILSEEYEAGYAEGCKAQYVHDLEKIAAELKRIGGLFEATAENQEGIMALGDYMVSLRQAAQEAKRE